MRVLDTDCLSLVANTNKPPDKSCALPLAPTVVAQQRQAPHLPRMPLLQTTRRMQYVALNPINKIITHTRLFA